MNTFIAYDKDTNKILSFITNDYTTMEETEEVFKNFENYNVIQTKMKVPEIFEWYKVVIENGVLVGFEEVQNESIDL